MSTSQGIEFSQRWNQFYSTNQPKYMNEGIQEGFQEGMTTQESTQSQPQELYQGQTDLKDLMERFDELYNTYQDNVAELARLNEEHISISNLENREFIAYVHYPGKSYSVPKSDITDVITKVRSKIPNTTICTESEIQFLVDNNTPVCKCGWVESQSVGVFGQPGYTSVYPSIHGTGSGCGGGQQRVISCGENGPSWADGKAGVYIKCRFNPSLFVETIETVGLRGSIEYKYNTSDYITTLVEQKESITNTIQTTITQLIQLIEDIETHDNGLSTAFNEHRKNLQDAIINLQKEAQDEKTIQQNNKTLRAKWDSIVVQERMEYYQYLGLAGVGIVITGALLHQFFSQKE